MPPRYIRVIRAIRGQIKIMYVFCGARFIRVSGKIDVAKGTFDRKAVVRRFACSPHLKAFQIFESIFVFQVVSLRAGNDHFEGRKCSLLGWKVIAGEAEAQRQEAVRHSRSQKRLQGEQKVRAQR